MDLNEHSPNVPIKAVKTIKEFHKGAAVTSVKFCDWHSKAEKAWMFVSADQDGRVLLVRITNVAFGLLNAEKVAIWDCSKDHRELNYQVISSRFFQPRFPST